MMSSEKSMSTTMKRRNGRLNLKDEEDRLEASNTALRNLESRRSVPASVISPSVINVASAHQTSLPIGHQTHHSFRSLAHSESDDEEFGAERASMSTPLSEKARRSSTFGATSRSAQEERYDSNSSFTRGQPCMASPEMEDVATSNIIHTLPNKLLTLIFEAGLVLTYPSLVEPKSPFVPITVKKVSSFMNMVMHVCHRWRQVAIHTPALWTTLHISRSRKALDNLPSVKDFRNPMPWVTEHLMRSQCLPLDISLDCRHISIKSVFNQLIPESHRWRSLVITIPSVQDLPNALSSLKKIPAPALETLEITSLKYHDSIAPNLTSFFRGGLSPNLSHVRLNRVSLSWLAFPLKGLTTLDLRFIIWPTFPHLAEMLSGSPNLQNLVLHIDNTAAKLLNRRGRAAISIPSLRSLEIRLFSQGLPTICPFLQIFSIPALESLTLREVTSSDWCRIVVYFRVNCTSYPVLRHLRLSCIRGLISVDSSAVRAFPQLTHLSLNGIYSSALCRLLVDERTDDGYHVPVWPNMMSLSIRGDVDLNVSLLERAIIARRRMGRALTNVDLDHRMRSDHR
ncbi:uncharacterized protein EV420DRAFT_1135516 [Desarmillaria tabescens]|uniref:F-box domain-containing protein n=1 Tax=Armillaria tabescens TaxID=1929756 RepID=A0AA39MNG5_ARMTA|nr:uncharacterized protein EV420DRAFT_1135516 [Desarmillaria tabescens]KAK0440179.1 hypothetical protein EV420DRAFT_1135516 [Desarmillaria tabescens]